MRKILLKLANNEDEKSISSRLRRKRFNHFIDFFNKFEKPVSVLDVGGTYNFWKNMGFDFEDVHITICNLEVQSFQNERFNYIKCDGRDMSCFSNKEFDIVFSNSVIEHAGTHEDQLKMAKEIRRVGKSFFIQTPYYHFPIEPHFLFPFYQYLPTKLKIYLVRNFSLGWFNKTKNPIEAKKLVLSINLFTQKRLKSLFPESKIIKERFLFFTKSLIALKS